MLKELAVPIRSANEPNGTALSGINPNVIIAKLIVRPRNSVADFI